MKDKLWAGCGMFARLIMTLAIDCLAEIELGESLILKLKVIECGVRVEAARLREVHALVTAILLLRGARLLVRCLRESRGRWNPPAPNVRRESLMFLLPAEAMI
jgi:hypothetical protein